MRYKSDIYGQTSLNTDIPQVVAAAVGVALLLCVPSTVPEKEKKAQDGNVSLMTLIYYYYGKIISWSAH